MTPRIKCNLSVAEVAEQVGVSAATIYFGKTITLDRAMQTLCKVLKLPPNDR